MQVLEIESAVVCASRGDWLTCLCNRGIFGSGFAVRFNRSDEPARECHCSALVSADLRQTEQ
jgi:hypothetical protein